MGDAVTGIDHSLAHFPWPRPAYTAHSAVKCLESRGRVQGVIDANTFVHRHELFGWLIDAASSPALRSVSLLFWNFPWLALLNGPTV